MACLTAGLVEGRSSWSSAATLGLLGSGVLLLATFAVIELARHRPMLELRVFADPRFVASLTGALLTGLAVIGLMSYSAPFHGWDRAALASALLARSAR